MEEATQGVTSRWWSFWRLVTVGSYRKVHPLKGFMGEMHRKTTVSNYIGKHLLMGQAEMFKMFLFGNFP